MSASYSFKNLKFPNYVPSSNVKSKEFVTVAGIRQDVLSAGCYTHYQHIVDVKRRSIRCVILTRFGAGHQ
jgi:hypothetical protein